MNRPPSHARLAAWAKSVDIARRTLVNIAREVCTHYDPIAAKAAYDDTTDDTIDQLHDELLEAITAAEHAHRRVAVLAAELQPTKRGAA